MQHALERVREHVAPACSFLIDYLSLFADSAGLGGMSVYFGDRELHQPSLGNRVADMTQDEIEQLAEQTRMQTAQMRRFCRLMRRFPEGYRRCLNCDISWIARAERTKRTQVYQCHAGLTDIVVPIVVRGKYVGRILTGQLFQSSRLRGGFVDIWDRVKDLGNLEKEELEATYHELVTVTNTELRNIVGGLEGAAHKLGALWENMITLLEQEKQLLHMRVYLEREYADWLLSGRSFTEGEALARAKSIGLNELPTAVIVAQLDLMSQAAFEMDSSLRHQTFVNLVESIHTVSRDVPNSLVTSIQPEEVVMFCHLPETRNPDLKSLRAKELVARIEREVKRYTDVPVRIGVGLNNCAVGQMNVAYHEARAALGKRLEVVASVSHEGKGDGEWLASLHQEFASCLFELRDAIAGDERQTVARLFEKSLHIIAACPEQHCEVRRFLFTELVYRVLDCLTEIRSCEADIERLRLDYMESFPGLRTVEDFTDWFRNRLAKTALHIDSMCMSPEEMAVARACSLVNKGLDRAINRNSVAHAVAMSESHFGCVFRRCMGLSFREYVQLARIAQAQRLLLQPGKSVSEVALDVGYADMSSFTRAFTKICGVSPSQYRHSPRGHAPVSLPKRICAQGE